MLIENRYFKSRNSIIQDRTMLLAIIAVALYGSLFRPLSASRTESVNEYKETAMISEGMTRASIARRVGVTVAIGMLFLANLYGAPSTAGAQATNSKAALPDITAIAPPKITAYCKIAVNISNHPTVSGIYNVDAAGHITLPLETGEKKIISVCDLTAREAGLVIDKFVRDDLKNPYVTVKLLKTRDQRTFTVYGGVVRPGQYKFDKNLHLSDTLKLAGGLLPDVKHGQGVFMRNGKMYDLTASLSRLANPGKSIDDNLLIEPDDVIFVREQSPNENKH